MRALACPEPMALCLSPRPLAASRRRRLTASWYGTGFVRKARLRLARAAAEKRTLVVLGPRQAPSGMAQPLSPVQYRMVLCIVARQAARVTSGPRERKIRGAQCAATSWLYIVQGSAQGCRGG